jgi:hypothetical protein
VHKSTWTQDQRAQPKEQSVRAAEIRGASARAAHNQELMFQQKILGHEGFGSSGPEEAGQGAHQLKED